MQIIREVNLSEEEVTKITEAGQLLGAINRSKEADEFDKLSESAIELLQALQKVLNNILSA